MGGKGIAPTVDPFYKDNADKIRQLEEYDKPRPLPWYFTTWQAAPAILFWTVFVGLVIYMLSKLGG